MLKSDLKVGDKVIIAKVFFERQRHQDMIGQIGTVERVFKTKDQVKLKLTDGDYWYATPCNLLPYGG